MITWSTWKWLEDPLNFVEIKNPFGSLQSNLMADAWWVPPICFWKRCVSETPYCALCVLTHLTWSQCLKDSRIEDLEDWKSQGLKFSGSEKVSGSEKISGSEKVSRSEILQVWKSPGLKVSRSESLHSPLQCTVGLCNVHGLQRFPNVEWRTNNICICVTWTSGAGVCCVFPISKFFFLPSFGPVAACKISLDKFLFREF